jgi:hypothetical protein
MNTVYLNQNICVVNTTVHIYDLHNEQMAKNDMTALLQFLQSHDYTKGHPDETSLIAAINDMNNKIGVTEALVVLKAALNEEEGWLMKVLQEHKNDDAFVSAWDVCVRIYSRIRFLTGDSYAPNRPDYGAWHYVDFENADDKLKLQEIQSYCDFMLSCTIYRNFLVSRLDGELEKTNPGKLEAITVLFSEYPRIDQLMAFDSNPQSTEMGVRYHTSYFRSRSWCLANMYIVMDQLQTYKKTFFDQFPEISQDRHTRLFNTLLQEYKKWEDIALARLNTTFKNIQNREVTGTMGNLTALLEELKCCRT